MLSAVKTTIFWPHQPYSGRVARFKLIFCQWQLAASSTYLSTD